MTKEKKCAMIENTEFGAIAQLVEHLNGIEGASGSSPLSSICLNPVSIEKIN